MTATGGSFGEPICAASSTNAIIGKWQALPYTPLCGPPDGVDCRARRTSRREGRTAPAQVSMYDAKSDDQPTNTLRSSVRRLDTPGLAKRKSWVNSSSSGVEDDDNDWIRFGKDTRGLTNDHDRDKDPRVIGEEVCTFVSLVHLFVLISSSLRTRVSCPQKELESELNKRTSRTSSRTNHLLEHTPPTRP